MHHSLRDTTTEPLTLRSARPQDAPDIVAMVRGLAADTGMPRVPAVTAEQIVTYAFGAEPWLLLWLAETGGRAVGLLLGNAVLSTSRGLRGLYVGDLYVNPALRGQRIGEALLRHALREGGFGFVKLEVLDTNAAGRRFYQRLGFTPAQGDGTLFLEPEASAAFLAREG